jgi:hypothetical protein
MTDERFRVRLFFYETESWLSKINWIFNAMLSTRGQANAAQLDIPWRFAKGTTYDPVTNPGGLISFGTAENALMQKELEEFANKVLFRPFLLSPCLKEDSELHP